MGRILVAGGGFAGVWAALAAAREASRQGGDIEVVLVSRDPYLTIRPRLYEKNPEGLRLPLEEIIGPVGARLTVAEIASIDTAGKSVAIETGERDPQTLQYDRLVLAAGSRLPPLSVPGFARYGWNVDTYDAALRLDRHIASLVGDPRSGSNTFVVVGAGLTGIELATGMRERIAAHAGDGQAAAAKVMLLQRGDTVAEHLQPHLRPTIKAALREAGVEVLTGTTIEHISADEAVLSGGRNVATRTVVSTVGMVASPLARELGVKLDGLGRVPTDVFLRVPGVDGVFAAGDVARARADGDYLALMSCQHAITMGRFAGYNAARDLTGGELLVYLQPDYVTCIDLGPAGALFTRGWDREIEKTGAEGKAVKRFITHQAIYPPAGDREALLAAAEPGQPARGRA